MWAYRLEAPERLNLVEADAPNSAQLRSGEVILRTLAGGICGSDLPKFRGRKRETLGPGGAFQAGEPGYPMHEVVGEVVESRNAMCESGRLMVGWASSANGLAEYVVTDGDQLSTYDPALTPESAVLIQPLACVLHALARLSVRRKHVAVIGLGPIGLLFTHAVRAQGARKVTGIDPIDRSRHAAWSGLHEVCATTSANWARRLDADDRPDVVIEAVGHQPDTLNDALLGVATGGTVLSFGIPDVDVYPVNVEWLMRKNLTLIGGVTADRRAALAAADRYLREHPELASAMVTDTFPRADAQAAFELACIPAVDRLKIVLSLS